MKKCIACEGRIWAWQKAASNGVMHSFCEKVWDRGYEARRKLEHMVAETHGLKNVSDLFVKDQQQKKKQ
jgi:hypothetical protein